MVVPDATTIDVVNTAIGGTALALSGALASREAWRFRHPLMVSCQSEWARNPDGTQRAFDAWRVRLMNVRHRPVAVEEIWFVLDNGAVMQAKPEDGTRFPIRLDDHDPIDIRYDLDRFSEPGEPRRIRCAVIEDSAGRRHAAWVGPKPRFWWLRRPPKRRIKITTAHFRAPS